MPWAQGSQGRLKAGAERFAASAAMRASASSPARSSRKCSAIAAGARSGDPASKGGCGSYSMFSCSVLAWSSPREAEVEACRDAAAGDAVAVDHRPPSRRLGAEERQQLARHPVARRLIALKQARRAEQQRACADARHIARPRAPISEEVERPTHP